MHGDVGIKGKVMALYAISQKRKSSFVMDGNFYRYKFFKDYNGKEVLSIKKVL